MIWETLFLPQPERGRWNRVFDSDKRMSNKPKILWLSDFVGWAFHNKSTALTEKLSNYDHVILQIGGMTKNHFWRNMAGIKPDIIMMMHPSSFQMFKDLNNIVFTTAGTRAMES